MPGIQAAYGAQKRESGLSAVSLRSCEPLALIPVNKKKTISEANSDRKWLQRATLGLPGGESNE
jgi:hypothetical protein